MKITFFSNFLNHHQLPICEELKKLTNHQFFFVATEPIPMERLQLGYKDMNSEYEFVIRSYDSTAEKEKALLLGKESDVVIIGSAPEEYIEERLKRNKITFRYSERFFKKGTWRIISPNNLKVLYNEHFKYKNKKLYLLCAGTYVSYDFSIVNCYIDKAYKWGYFPKVIKYDIDTLINQKKNDKISILWVGRLIDWKHPEIAVQIARVLKQKKYNFEMNIVGNGEMEKKLKEYILTYKLSDVVSMVGSVPADKVRTYMERANIFLFTSDFFEGWGAVLNEAMNSACAVVCSHAIGAAGYLIDNKTNGVIYNNNRKEELLSEIEKLIIDQDYREMLGKNAYYTMINEWNPHNTAIKFLELCNALLCNNDIECSNGPCSKAEIISPRMLLKRKTNK